MVLAAIATGAAKLACCQPDEVSPVKVAVPMTGPLLVMVSRYCSVAAAGAVIVAVVVAPATPRRCDLPAPKSLTRNWKVAVVARVLVPAVVVKEPAAMLFRLKEAMVAVTRTLTEQLPPETEPPGMEAPEAKVSAVVVVVAVALAGRYRRDAVGLGDAQQGAGNEIRHYCCRVVG